MRVRLWSGLALLGILMAYGLPGAAASAGPTVNVTTGSPGYLPGATVTIQGSVMVGSTPVNGADVALEADGATTGQTYWVDEVTTDASGSFTDQFMLPASASQESAIQDLGGIWRRAHLDDVPGRDAARAERRGRIQRRLDDRHDHHVHGPAERRCHRESHGQ